MTQYIDKSAVIAEIEKLQDSTMDDNSNFCTAEAQAEYDVLCVLEEYLNTLEVKEDVVSNDTLSNSLEISRHGNSRIGENNTIEVKEMYKQSLTKDLKTAAGNYAFTQNEEDEVFKYYAFIAGAEWRAEHLWKDAQGDDLPEIDREVVALIQDYPDDKEHLRIAYAHRPTEYWDGKNILTGEVTRHKPMRHDKGGWNLPNVKYWLDVELPKGE